MKQISKYLENEVTINVIGCSAARLPVKLEWNDRTIKEEVAWFQYEQDPSLNSNVYKVAQDLVQKHFPGELPQQNTPPPWGSGVEFVPSWYS